jgi:signal transduction histidine kinase
MQEEMSKIVWAINPNNDKLENLILFIKRSVIETLESQGMKVNYEISDAVLKQNWDVRQKKEIILVFKEIANNIAKHSKATIINVVIKYAGENVIFKIMDNGVGFKLDQNHIGNGLKNINYRIAKIGGQTTINSDTNGTSIEITLPISIAS